MSLHCSAVRQSPFVSLSWYDLIVTTPLEWSERAKQKTGSQWRGKIIYPCLRTLVYYLVWLLECFHQVSVTGSRKEKEKFTARLLDMSTTWHDVWHVCMYFICLQVRGCCLSFWRQQTRWETQYITCWMLWEQTLMHSNDLWALIKQHVRVIHTPSAGT